MNTTKRMMVIFFAVCLASPTVAMAGKGYMGGSGSVVVAEEPVPVTGDDDTNEGDTGGIPDTVVGPLNDKMSDAGKLYGDLYVILRQQGTVGDRKLVPDVNADGSPKLTYGFQLFVEVVNDTTTPDAIVGGEPVLTVMDPGDTNTFADYGWYAADTNDDGIGDTAVQSPFPAQCVQPAASYERWGNISSKTGLTKNRLPMTISYDATWHRSECEVGQLDGTVTVENGGVVIPVNPWFIEPCLTPVLDTDGNPVLDADGNQTYEGTISEICKWEDPNNGIVTYPYGVLWTAIIGEVHFGRLNLGRSPEAVLQAAFDEAINTINSPDTIAIEIDAAGRLLLTKNVYDEFLVDKATGLPLLLGTVKKAIDSPLENVALYVKLMKDGHLVTPGDERMPIDRSKNGGIPLWKMLELTDGPGAKALRPTIDIDKMEAWGLDSLVNVTPVDYLTYYICLNDAGSEVPCLIWDYDPVQPEIEKELVGNPAAVSRELLTELASTGCPDSGDVDNPYFCEGPFNGITSDDEGAPTEEDLNFAASFISAAADKTGHMTVDMIVYLNSILGINQVLGYGTDPDTAEIIDYGKNPVYFNYNTLGKYSRNTTFGVGARGNASSTGGGVDHAGASTYNGYVTVLQGTSPSWTETDVPILSRSLPWDYVVWESDATSTTGVKNIMGIDNIFGFTQQADDNLSVINFIHTYQIPGQR